jgi:DNA repair protein RadC
MEQMSLFDAAAPAPVLKPARSKRQQPSVREALAPYLDFAHLRGIVGTDPSRVYEALRVEAPPAEVKAFLDGIAAVLQPGPREQIRSPQDCAAMLMVSMGHLDQEELRVVLLDTKNRVQGVEMIYRGSVNSAIIRVGEVFKPAVRANSTAIVVTHNHPSGDPTPSSEELLVTRQIVDVGKLIDIECLDHLVIGHGTYVSMRERGLGFAK